MQKGIPVSEGIAIASIIRLQTINVVTSDSPVQAEQVEQEMSKLERSIQQSSQQIDDLILNVSTQLGLEQTAILGAHLAFLQDQAFVGEMKCLISTELLSASSAVSRIMQQFIALFESMGDAYMRERADDIRDVGNRLLKNLAGESDDSFAFITEPFILVAEDLTPSETLQLPLDYVRGIAVAKGGATSHAAILARSLGIPAVVGIGHEVLETAKPGQLMILDGSTGDVYIQPNEATLDLYVAKREHEQTAQQEREHLRNLPAETVDGHHVKLLANMASPKEAVHLEAKGTEGVGLFRTEFLFMDRTTLPSEQEQFEAYRHVAEVFSKKPVIIRTLDVGGDKPLPYLTIPKEENPFLGWRAIRLCLSRPDLFKTQLRAILRASSFGNIALMFPMISHLEQFRCAKAVLEEVKAELRAESLPFNEQIPLGMMMEIPGACLMADHFAKEVQFFSIGTNDLVQYTLAVDRLNENISHLYSYYHPAVLKLIAHVIDASHRAGIWTGLCGEMASDPLATELLLGLGLDEFSGAVTAMPQVKQNIRTLHYTQAKQLAEYVLTLGTADEVQHHLRNRKK